MSMITIIGRGHSGTRAISQTLSDSGVYMGAQLNKSYDLIPPDNMYDACRIIARHIIYKGGTEWDFNNVINADVDDKFKGLIEQYLSSVLQSDALHKGWKIPETTLVLPWIIKMFPEAKYIYWVRDPRDSIAGSHITDDMNRFGIPYEETDNLLQKRAFSWKYQREIMKATPLPHNYIKIRFEDFVLRQDETLNRLEEFLGFPLVKISVRKDSIGRWKNDSDVYSFDVFKDDIQELGYTDM